MALIVLFKSTCFSTVQEFTQKCTKYMGVLTELLKTVFKAIAGEIKEKHAAFLSFFFAFFFAFSVFLFIILFTFPPSLHPSDCLAVCQSVRPPDGLVQAARGAHGGGGVAVAAVGLHALALVVQTLVHQTVGPSRGPGAGQQAGGGALAPSVARRHHGELVGSGACAVIQVGVGLEVLALVV